MIFHNNHKLEKITEMDLLSVICVDSNHYVCFTRDIAQNRWLFHDSMASRVCKCQYKNFMGLYIHSAQVWGISDFFIDDNIL